MRNHIVIAIAAVLIVAGLSVLVASGASHNDAPLIAEDPSANNTDTYAFVSTERGRSNYVTLIANYIPNEEPDNGPTHYRFSDGALYEVMVDVNGDAKEDLTYQFQFKNHVVNGNTFLYNTAQIGLPPDPSDPSSQYANLNVQQSYTLTEVVGDRRTGSKKRVMLENARVAPANVGPQSTPNYKPLADAAVHTIKFDNSIPDGKVFVGPRDEGFYVDLMAAFDLLGGFTNPQRSPVDSFNGFNVHTIALEIPKARLGAAGDTDGIIGMWASASRQKVRVLREGGKRPANSDKLVQVSRLGMPLTNELLMPLHAKDLFNASEPKDDVDNGFDDLITDPGSTQGGAALIPLINGLTGCTPVNGRVDLDLIFLKGIDAGTADALDNAVPSLAPFTAAGGNQDTQKPGGPTRADMLRLNYNVAPSGSPSPLGFFGGDPAGFPNGRRVGDDIVDVALKGAGGAVLHVLGAISCLASLNLSDGVQQNDAPYLDQFPYLGAPHQGYSHQHTHGNMQAALGVGFGLLAGGLALGLVFTLRRRRQTVA